MRLKRLGLKNFKRFTDLEIYDIPQTTRLVLLVGSNGSGKSSVFEALHIISGQMGKASIASDSMHKKDNTIQEHEYFLEFYDHGKVGLFDQVFNRIPEINGNSFYGRSSFRQVPQLNRNSLGATFNVKSDSDRPISFSQRDERFQNDLEYIFGKLMRLVFVKDESGENIKATFLNPINESLLRIFGGDPKTAIQVVTIIPPLHGKAAEVTFKKGNSTFHYNSLSAGEKEVFNVLVNLFSRSEHYTDAIYFMDELDLHLNTTIQHDFLKEILEVWLPPDSQLFTATHSLGFIEYAKRSPDSVIINLENRDFDAVQKIFPEPKGNQSVYNIAIGEKFLEEFLGDKELVFVENKDKATYASVGLLNKAFASDPNRDTVYHKVRNLGKKGIVDRDFLSDDDITEIKKSYPSLIILEYYSLENYLYHPENLEEVHKINGKPFDKAVYIQDLTAAKNKCVDEIIIGIEGNRNSYPFFKEPEFKEEKLTKRFKQSSENRAQVKSIADNLKSDSFDDFYKHLPMKSYCTTVQARQNWTNAELFQTNWFKEQIEKLLDK